MSPQGFIKEIRKTFFQQLLQTSQKVEVHHQYYHWTENSLLKIVLKVGDSKVWNKKEPVICLAFYSMK